MAAFSFPALLGNLNQIGVFQFLLPFLLILAIVYGVLRFAVKDIFPKSITGLISIVIAFFAMNYSGATGVGIASFFTSLFGVGSIVLAGILVVIILLGIIGFKIGDVAGGKHKGVAWIFILAIILIGLVVFSGAVDTGIVPGFSLYLGSDFWTLIIFVIVLVAAFWALSKEDKPDKPDK